MIKIFWRGVDFDPRRSTYLWRQRLDGDFLGMWWRGFAVALVMALPVGFVVVPLIQELVARLTAN